MESDQFTHDDPHCEAPPRTQARPTAVGRFSEGHLTVTVKILRNERSTGQARDAELHFSGAIGWPEVDRLRIWRRRTAEGAQSLPTPFIVSGDKTNFALLRAIDDPKAQNQLRGLVLRSYRARTNIAEVAS